MQLQFHVDGQPIGQGRPRFVSRGKFVRAYDPKKSRDYKNSIKAILSECYFDDPIEKDIPVKVIIKAVFPIPKSYTKKRKQGIIEGLERPTKKPDIDNIEKIILDAMSGVVYYDDAQVCSTSVIKKYGKNTTGYVSVYVTTKID